MGRRLIRVRGWSGTAGPFGGVVSLTVLSLTAVLLLLTGCAVAENGSAVPDPAALRVLTPSQVFGDAHTVDPCSLLNVDTLRAADATATIGAGEALDACAVRLRKQDGTTTNVTVGPLQTRQDLRGQPGGPYRDDPVGRGMTVLIPVSDVTGFCGAYLSFRDGERLTVQAIASDVDNQPNVCPAAQAVAENVAAQLRAGHVRHVTFPQGSAGELDPCALVPATSVAAAGLSDVPPLEYPQRHECEWIRGSVPNETSVNVFFLVGPKPTKALSGATVASIAGRQTVVSPLPLGNTVELCTAETGLNPYTYGSIDDRSQVEVADVTVRRPQGATFDPCAVARTVAAAMWPQLPAVTG